MVLIGKDPFNDKEDKLFLFHFEDNDNYWVSSDLGNYVEYFTRLKNDDAEPINSADPKGRSAD